jgi:transcriptional regulator with XRE-family HTH domain
MRNMPGDITNAALCLCLRRKGRSGSKEKQMPEARALPTVAQGDKGSVRAEINAARERMRGLGFGYSEIAAEFARRYRLRPRKAYRAAYGWSLTEAATRFNARAAEERTDPAARASMTGPHLCEYEQWPDGGRKPSVFLLILLSKIYDTDVLSLLDFADHENLAAADRMILLHTERPKDSETSPFGAEVARLLAARGWSLRELARRVPCSAGYLSKVMRGQKTPSRNMAARLDELLGAEGRLIASAPEHRVVNQNPGLHGTDARQPGTGGISVTLPYAPGRLVIEVSGLEPATGHAMKDDTLHLVPGSLDQDTGHEQDRAG